MHEAKSASMLEKHAYGERERLAGSQRLWSSESVQIKTKCSVSYLNYSVEVSQQICVMLLSTITYSSSEVPNMWLCKSSLLSSCLSFQCFLSLSPLLIHSLKILHLNFLRCFHLLKEELLLLWIEKWGKLESGRSCLCPPWSLFILQQQTFQKSFFPFPSPGRCAGI